MTELSAPPARDAAPADIPTFYHYIAGEWCDSTGGETFESRDPADRNDVIGRFQQGTKADVAMAVSAETLPRLDAVLVDDAQRPEAHVFRVVIVAERERVAAVEPPEVRLAPFARRPDQYHPTPRMNGPARLSQRSTGRGRVLHSPQGMRTEADAVTCGPAR